MEVIRIIALLVILICINSSAQSPYAIFGDNSKMLEAQKECIPNIYRVIITNPNDKLQYYIDFNFKEGIATFSDSEGNVFRQDSISENIKAIFTTPDPHADKYCNLSPYNYCAGNSANAMDPDGTDWYQNIQTLYYTWFNGNQAIEGFNYIGGKGSVLGEEFENILNNVLFGKDGLGLESLYSNGFTIDIAPTDKGGLLGSRERGWYFLDEFVYGCGPEFTVLLDNHPYTQTIMKDKFAKSCQDVVRFRGDNSSYINVGRPEFFPWQASPFSPMQFIGTYRYDGYSSRDGKTIYNIATDSKSVTSLGYHIPFLNNHRRSQKTEFGTTYQFYLWSSPK